jgi:esterase/lipase superfamily enzyme
MGNRILAGAVKNLNEIEKQNVIPKNILKEFFHHLIMTGADVNKNTLNDFIPESDETISHLAKKILLFHNAKDKALLIARIIFNESERLGRNMTEEDIHLLPPNVDFIHLEKCSKDKTGHNYFSKNPHVSAGIKRSLLEFHFDGTAIDYERRKRMVFNMKTGKVVRSEFY